MLVWLGFLVLTAVIAYAGYHLSVQGDRIAELTGVSRGWIGLALLASVTSLPELVTGISAVSLAQVPNIAVGDVLGSCVFNLLMIVLMDLLSRRESVYTRASHGHILGAGFGVMLIGLAGFNILLAQQGPQPYIGHVGVYSPMIIILYLVALRTVFLYESNHHAVQAAQAGESPAPTAPEGALRTTILRFVAAAVAVVLAAVALPFLAEEMARQMGWSNSFVGTVFVAFSTSLPELAVTVSALRLGSVEMAIGNLFGSNLFNIAILAVDDLFFLEGPILSHVTPMHAVSAFSAMMMSGVAIVGLLFRPEKRLFKTIGWVSLALFLMYMVNAYVLYLYGV
ncbi:MAG: sodium:calcium antiporter [Halothiobacillaceae bacterium]|nr:MAG: sodium:calcium antiporter [Halothiobacillaceae bacterium]